MNVSDFVVDYDNGLGIITKIENELIYVSFDLITYKTYSINDDKITIVDDDFIDKIKNEKYITFLPWIEERAQEYMNKISEFSYRNGYFYCNVQGTRKYTVTIYQKYNHIQMKCTCPYNNDCKHSAAALNYLKKQISILPLAINSEKEITRDLIVLTKDFINNFFDFNKYELLCKEIKNLNFEEIAGYCIVVFNLDISIEYIRYILLIIANNTIYLEKLNNYFINSSYYLIKEVFQWVLKRKNYSKEYNYIYNQSVVLFNNKEYLEWIKLVLEKGKIYDLVNSNDIMNSLFIAIIKQTSNYEDLIHILNDYPNYNPLKDAYITIIFNNVSKEDKRKIVFEKKLIKIDENMINEFSFEEIIGNYKSLNGRTRKKYIYEHIDEIIEADVSIAINMLLYGVRNIYLSDLTQISTLINRFPKNKYLKKYIQSLRNGAYVTTIDQIVLSQINKEYENEDE